MSSPASSRSTGAVLATQHVPAGVSGTRRVSRSLARTTRRSVTGDRTEFIGRNGSLRRPAALGREALSNRDGTGARSLRRHSRRRSISQPCERTGRHRPARRRRRRRAGARARRALSRSRARRRSPRRRAAVLGRRARNDRPCARRIGRWTSCSIAGSSIKRSPAASGDARRSTSRAARSDSATSCRTPSRC